MLVASPPSYPFTALLATASSARLSDCALDPDTAFSMKESTPGPPLAGGLPETWIALALAGPDSAFALAVAVAEPPTKRFPFASAFAVAEAPPCATAVALATGLVPFANAFAVTEW
jgi:hypothetical protein